METNKHLEVGEASSNMETNKHLEVGEASSNMETNNPLSCRYCDKTFTLLNNKRRHEKNIHLKFVQDHHLRLQIQHNTSIHCTECTTTYHSLNGYREHRKQVHGVEIKKIEYQFVTQQEFEDWKDGLEKDVGVNYNLQRGPTKSHGFSKQIYYCRRSGVQQKLKEATGCSKKRIRCGKSQGSSKIGQFCTSSIEVIKRDGTDILQITYYPDHSDHELNYPSLVHMKLPKSDKDKIAGMIMHGISYDKILDSIRETAGGTRASILERVDLVNIAKEFGLFGMTQLHSDDSTSVRLFVEKLKEESELLYFKDQDEIDLSHPQINKRELVLGFMKKNQETYFKNQLTKISELKICMDSTHCISQYRGYQLTTLMSVSDLNQGFPVAFLISSTVDADIVKVFLDAVKDHIGLIKAHIFMSDDDPLFRKAWRASMAEAPGTRYLNCSWHTDQTFRKSIAKIKASTGEKAVVYQMIRAIMDETDEDKFEELCQGFLKYLLDAGYTEFHNYFKKNYLDEARVKLWPKCHRQKLTLNTNNHLESMHKVLKYIYLRGKKAKRLDNTLFALEKMVNDKLYSQMLDLMRNRKIAAGKFYLSERHREGKDLEVFQQDHGIFIVESASYKNKQYEVKINNSVCKKCTERCSYCNVCKCMYCCTCEDNLRRNNVCKHIHAVADFCKNVDNVQAHKSDDPAEDIQMLQDIACSHNCAPEELVEKKRCKLDNLLVQLKVQYQNCSDLDALESLITHMAKGSGLLTAATKYPLSATSNSFPVDTNTIKEPANKKTVKQVRLYSTQKKKKKNESLLFKKPSVEVRREISDSLTRTNEDVGSIPAVSDGRVDYEHSYGTPSLL